MSARSEHGGGEKAMRDEIDEIEREESMRVERLLSRWRRVITTLREMTDGPA